MAQSTEPVSS